jgi:hypothetical protein
VEPVGELDEDDPDVLGHREEHLPDVLGLLLLVGMGAELGELGDPVDQVGDIGAETLFDVGEVELGVLGDVMEQRRFHGRRVDAEVGHDLRGGDRVRDIRLAGGAELERVRLDGEVERPVELGEIRSRVVPGNRGAELLARPIERRRRTVAGGRPADRPLDLGRKAGHDARWRGRRRGGRSGRRGR